MNIENCNTMIREIEDNTNKWKGIPRLWIGRTNTVKTATLPKAIYSFNVLSTKIATAFFTELQHTILQFVWNHRRP